MKANFVHPTAVIGEPFRRYQFGRIADFERGEVLLGTNVYVGAQAIIGTGAKIGDDCVIDHQCIIEPDATVGNGCLLTYRAIIGSEAVIGEGSVIGGFVAERCVVGKGCRIFGKIVHNQHDTTAPWDEFETPEPSAQFGDYCFVGFDSLIVGGVTIGERAYICANAVVTRDVPALHIAFGTNSFVPVSKWKGRLASNPVFFGKIPPTSADLLP